VKTKNRKQKKRNKIKKTKMTI